MAEKPEANASRVDLVASAVTALFVPGDRPERFAKAAASAADIVIVDLEDAVEPAAKSRALTDVLAALCPTSRQALRALVRVNASRTRFYETEIIGLIAVAHVAGHGLLGIMVPKAESAEEIRTIREQLPSDLALIPLVESAAGLCNALDLARVPGVSRLAFGAVDYALDVNATSERFMDHARSHLVVVSRAAGIAPPLDSPSTEIQDLAAVSKSATSATAFGFGGKLCIHPTQISAVHAAFAPRKEELDWAKAVVRAEAGATQVNGHMIDRPVIERAKKVLRFENREATNRRC